MRGRAAGIVGVVGLHLALIAVMLQHEPVRQSLNSVAPIIVSLLPAEDRPPPPKPPPPRRPQRSVAPTERAVPLPIVPTVSNASPITPLPAPEAAPPVSVAAEPVPLPVVPPRFNADYLQNPAPSYPALSRRMREQGKVLVRVLVNTDGLAERIELKSSSGSTRLDQSALETVRTWKFVPARQGEQKVAAWVVVPITFTLDG